GPRPGPGWEPGGCRRASRAGGRDASRPAALHRRAARRTGHAPGPCRRARAPRPAAPRRGRPPLIGPAGRDRGSPGTTPPAGAGPGMTGEAAPAAPRGCAEPLASAYDVALLDLDGVVYIGRSPVAGAAGSLAKAKAAGLRVAFVTNNASRTPSAIAAQLTSLGVPTSPSDVVTSAQDGARLLAERLPPAAAVLIVGGIGLRVAVRERGFRPVSVASDRPAAVIQGYAPDIGYALLAEGALAVQAGAPFVGSNAGQTPPPPPPPPPRDRSPSPA